MHLEAEVNNVIAIFLATSGHSGVDRIMQNLIPSIASRGLRVDILRVNNHGPYLHDLPPNARIVKLGTSHAYSSLKPLIQYLQRERPAALLSDKDRVNRVALLAKKINAGATRVVVRTGTTVSKNIEARGVFQRWLNYLSMHYLYRWADAIVVPSQGAADDLAEFAHLPSDAISVLPSPVVTPALYQRSREPLDHLWFQGHGVPVILGVGELCARKDFATLIRAFAMVRRRQPCNLVILGEGPCRAELEKYIQDLGLSQQITLPGFVDNPYVFMARSDIYVHSAKVEGAPIALIEALALGIPVVSANCPCGPSEILQNGRFGPLVPVGDAAGMAQAIFETLKNPLPRPKLQEAAQPYDIEISTTAYLQTLGLGPAQDTGDHLEK